MTTGTVAVNLSGHVGDLSLDVAFSVPTHGITAIMGRSGSGKTTLLRAIAGLTHLKGSFHLADKCWQDDETGIFVPPHKRAVGYVFQEASLFKHLSVRENLAFGMKRRSKLNRPISAPDDIFRLEDVVDLLDVAQLLDRDPGTLSGGERQRIAIGRALLSQPDIMLMDEPLAALDHSSKQELLGYLERLHRSLSLPILYVSHDFAETSRLADHAVVLAAGKKKLSGPAEEIFAALDFHPPEGRHETSVVLRTMVSGHDTKNGLTMLKVGTQSISIPLSAVPAGQEIGVRIKASDIAVATQRPDFISIRNILTGTIRDIRDDGTSGLAELLLDVEGFAIRAQITHQAVTELQLETGLKVFALIKSMSLSEHQK